VIDRFAIQPEVSNLHQDRDLFGDKSLNPTFQLIGTYLHRLVAFLALGCLDRVPEIDRQTQKDNGHLKGEQNFLGLHDWVAGRSPSKARPTIPDLNLPNQTSGNRQVALDLAVSEAHKQLDEALLRGAESYQQKLWKTLWIIRS
jgi:hypothetical protein